MPSFNAANMPLPGTTAPPLPFVHSHHCRAQWHRPFLCSLSPLPWPLPPHVSHSRNALISRIVPARARVFSGYLQVLHHSPPNVRAPAFTDDRSIYTNKVVLWGFWPGRGWAQTFVLRGANKRSSRFHAAAVTAGRPRKYWAWSSCRAILRPRPRPRTSPPPSPTPFVSSKYGAV